MADPTTPGAVPQDPLHPDTGAQANVYQAGPAPASPAVPAPVDVNAGVTAGAPAPNSDMAPGRGMPLVAGPANSVTPKIGAGKLNFGFLIASIVGLVLIIILVFFLIHTL